MKDSVIIAMGLALMVAIGLLDDGCSPSAATPRPNGTPDADWTSAVLPAGFDAGSGGK